MVFANVLVRSLGFLVLTETRAIDSRLAFLKTKLAPNLEYFSSGISAYSGGVGILLQKSFAQKFLLKRWVVLEPGRIARLELTGPRGTLHIYIYIYIYMPCI